jgi:hypothetical protein
MQLHRIFSLSLVTVLVAQSGSGIAYAVRTDTAPCRILRTVDGLRDSPAPTTAFDQQAMTPRVTSDRGALGQTARRDFLSRALGFIRERTTSFPVAVRRGSVLPAERVIPSFLSEVDRRSFIKMFGLALGFDPWERPPSSSLFIPAPLFEPTRSRMRQAASEFGTHVHGAVVDEFWGERRPEILDALKSIALDIGVYSEDGLLMQTPFRNWQDLANSGRLLDLSRLRNDTGRRLAEVQSTATLGSATDMAAEWAVNEFAALFPREADRFPDVLRTARGEAAVRFRELWEDAGLLNRAVVDVGTVDRTLRRLKSTHRFDETLSHLSNEIDSMNTRRARWRDLAQSKKDSPKEARSKSDPGCAARTLPRKIQ